MRPEAEPWWRQATADIDTARHTLRGGHYYAASWFAQQCTEKGLKALFLEQRGTLPPRTHDLEFLGMQVGVSDEVRADLAAINPAFDLVRYPDPANQMAPVDSVSESVAVAHVSAAERIIEWLAIQLKLV